MRPALFVVACLLLVGCSSDPASDGSSSDTYAALRARCVAGINAYRASLGVAAYASWSDQGICSDEEAAADAKTGAAHGAFGKCTEMAQNECPSWPGPPETMVDNCLAAMWAEGPGEEFSKHGHYINMASTKYTKVACGFHQTADGKWWSVQNFR